MKIAVQAKEFAVQLTHEGEPVINYRVEGYACDLDTTNLSDALLALITGVQDAVAKVQEQCSPR